MTQKKMPHLLKQMGPEVLKQNLPNRVDLLSHAFTLQLQPRNASTSFKADLPPLHDVWRVHHNLQCPIPTFIDSVVRKIGSELLLPRQ